MHALCLAASLLIPGHFPQALAKEGLAANDNLMLDPRIAPARARVEAARKKIDDLRDHATDSDYRTIWVDGPGGPKKMRRVPTEEFAARIESAQAELKSAEEALRALERSLY